MSLKQLPTRCLGHNGPTVSAIGLGTMGIGAFYGKTDEEQAFKALTYAADRGMTFWDCADIYGTTESTLGKWFALTGRRSDIFLATKFGARDMTMAFRDPANKANSKPSYIRSAVQRSLDQLKTPYIDLYYQHRVDPTVPIEVVIETLREFVDKGQIRWLGLSECSATTLRRARAVKGIGEKVIAVQMEYSPYSLDIEKSGFAEVAKEAGVAIVAYSPLGRGLVSGKYRSRADFEPGDLRLSLPRFTDENFPKNLVLSDKIQAIADKYGATASKVVLAWILAEHPNFFPIPGCRTAERVEENGSGAELVLSSDDVKAIRKLSEEADVGGERNLAHNIAICKGECISIEEWKGE